MTSLSRLLHRSSASYIALALLGVIFFVVALDTVHQIGIAHADTAPVTVVAPVPVAANGVDSALAVVTLVIAALGAVLGGIGAALHLVAPRTKTTLDDRAAAKIDELLGLLRLVPIPTPSGTVATSFDSKTATTVKLPQSGRVHLGTAVLVALAALLALPLLGCGTLSSVPGAAESSVIDCTKADAAAITALVSNLGADAVTTALGTGAADWAKLEQDAIAQGKVIGGCALTEFVAAIGKASPTPAVASTRSASATPVASPAADGRAALERFRLQMGGAHWSTEAR